MYGGSFNYLYEQELTDMVQEHSDLTNMIIELENYCSGGVHPGAQKVLQDTKAIRAGLQSVRATLNSLQAAINLEAIDNPSLADCWRTVEWIRSNDYGPEDMEMMEQYDHKYVSFNDPFVGFPE